jgi:hypothetical protein
MPEGYENEPQVPEEQPHPAEIENTVMEDYQSVMDLPVAKMKN